MQNRPAEGATQVAAPPPGFCCLLA